MQTFYSLERSMQALDGIDRHMQKIFICKYMQTLCKHLLVVDTLSTHANILQFYLHPLQYQ